MSYHGSNVFYQLYGGLLIPINQNDLHQKPHSSVETSSKIVSKAKKKRIQEHYNSQSYISIYDKRYQDLQKAKFEALAQHFSSLHGIWLDFGCGTGLTWDLLHILPIKGDEKENPIMRTHYIGIDLAIGMLHHFSSKLRSPSRKSASKSADDDKAENTHTRSNLFFSSDVHLICADGEHLPLRNQSFNQVISLTTLQNLPVPYDGLKEIKRVSTSQASINLSVLQKSYPKETWHSWLTEIWNYPSQKILTVDSPPGEYQEDFLFSIGSE